MLLTTLLSLAAAIQPAGAAAPARQPQLAHADGQVAMTFGAGSAIYFARSTDGGRTFEAPVKVAEVAALALFLCSPAARHLTGQAVRIDAHTEGTQ